MASRGRVHPTEKPPALLEYLIEKIAPETILDPFMGGGSTLLAAKRQGKKAVGIETDEAYCEAAAKRCAEEIGFFENDQAQAPAPESE